MTYRIPSLAALLAMSCSLAPALAQQKDDDTMRVIVQQCPEVKARLDSAFSGSPDFDSIADAANKRIAQCEYFKDLSLQVSQGYDAFQQCRAGGFVGIESKKAELRTILRRIKSAAVQYCD